ncbi:MULTISPECIES: AAA family ATPase [unclassified Clostridium]|uniref:AAA family ATPase n=1 Tax=unclassified Clostridium TaxID=2614128 RepID=UPI00207AC2DF|nr:MULTISPECIES: AAA family ATPase [unclassified Clostridium]
MKKNISVGLSDFKELIENDNYFVDKSLLIKEFMQNGSKVILTPRPRRFGKTLNLSMLKYFFDIKTKNKTKTLFKGLKIENEDNIMKLQGQYPTIFLTFKNQQYDSYDKFEEGIKLLLANLFENHEYLLESDKLSELDKKKYYDILSKSASFTDTCDGVNFLMKCMHKHYDNRVMLFIDEYDVPIQEGYLKGYYEKMISFMRIMLTCALKDNVYLEKALVTGILRIAKESVFSGLNNLEVDTILGCNFKDKFGFTEYEVEELINYYNLSYDKENVKIWYNGYKFGGETIYNPWSVLNYIKNCGEGFRPYWINSSSNDLIKRLLLKGNSDIKVELEELIRGNSINKIIDDNIIMSEVEESNENLWSFLTLSGYLKSVKTEVKRGRVYCELKIPNEEVHVFYENLIKKWFKESMTNEKYIAMINSLISGDVEIFNEVFSEFVVNNISYFDVSGKEPEKVYHAFVLGMLISISDEYEVKSNKESGYGRYDVMIIPKNISKLGVIIEFKKVSEFSNATIDEATNIALTQIEEKKYETELLEKGITNIIKLAIVFKGKEVKVTKG